jgi:hypothetical protein
MFVGFGTLSGGAHVVGQEADRNAFQLVSAQKAAYGGRPWGTTAGVAGRKERNAETVSFGEKLKEEQWQAR